MGGSWKRKAKRKDVVLTKREKRGRPDLDTEDGLRKVAEEIRREGDLAEASGESMPKFSSPIPAKFHGLIREAERDITAATSMKALKAVAKEYGVKGYSKMPSDQRGVLEDLIRERIGMMIGVEQAKSVKGDGASAEAPAKSLAEELHRIDDERSSKRSVRACDSIPEWIELWHGENPESLEQYLDDNDVFLVIGRDGKKEPEDSKVWESQQISDLFRDMFKLLDAMSPSGQYFGTNERGEGEWGWWEHYIAAPVSDVPEQGVEDGNGVEVDSAG